jgi:hypothetical protein
MVFLLLLKFTFFCPYNFRMDNIEVPPASEDVDDGTTRRLQLVDGVGGNVETIGYVLVDCCLHVPTVRWLQ